MMTLGLAHGVITSSLVRKMAAHIYLPTPTLKMVSIELTNICNLSCEVCWSQNPQLHKPRPRGYMTEQSFNKVLSELEAYSDLTVALSYSGESTLHPRFKEFAEKASCQGFSQLQLATNGVTLNKQMNKVLAECFTGLAVSLHNHPLLGRVVEKTKRLYDVVRKVNSCTMRVNVVAEEFTPAEVDRLEHELHRHCDGFKVFGMITEDLHEVGGRRDYPFCPCMFSYLAVTWDGEALPCCHILSPGMFSLGNVLKSSIGYVFNGTQYECLRYGKLAGTPCLNCDVYVKKNA